MTPQHDVGGNSGQMSQAQAAGGFAVDRDRLSSVDDLG